MQLRSRDCGPLKLQSVRTARSSGVGTSTRVFFQIVSFIVLYTRFFIFSRDAPFFVHNFANLLFRSLAIYFLL